ncbi:MULTISPECIES: ATP-binding protein [unclassified Pseudomonas]|uniref:ATP-binding protein n=1 Tax=unclassified Pseudomonas TaxID=196821 RepID=UPI001022883F|nr:ATP-binding protein [Pseudomonas sp. SWI36]
MASNDSLRSRIRPHFLEGLDEALASNTEPAKAEFRCMSPRFTLERDVVMSSALQQQLAEAVAKIEHYQTIYVEWGFAAVDPAGKGTILNFYGPPGTGKTLTAEAFAGSLSKKIMLVSIADLESKFMGDTSKNIAAVFRSAQAENAVLFFDEADTLLGKRLSSVTQGIDNEVNAMRSTLLIELERHEGIVIFATNFVKNYDSAFVSRISQHVGFELPGELERRAIWAKLLVPGIPLTDDLDLLLSTAAQASQGLSGREIRTCMRLALAKAVSVPVKPALALAHLQEAIDQVVTALSHLHSNNSKTNTPTLEAARKLLGVS